MQLWGNLPVPDVLKSNSVKCTLLPKKESFFFLIWQEQEDNLSIPRIYFKYLIYITELNFHRTTCNIKLMCFFPTKADGILFQNSHIFICLLDSFLWYKLTRVVIFYHTFYLLIYLFKIYAPSGFIGA